MHPNEKEKEDLKKPIKVYARVRPLNDDEVERDEQMSVETFEDGKRIKIIDKKHSQETTYYFDGVFAGTDPNQLVYEHTTRDLLSKLLNGMNCALLTYGQTGSGKTFTLMADGCITEFAIIELFQKIADDKTHKYKITCSFVQVYLEKVFDLLNPAKKEELPVREHPKKGIYVSNLSHHQATSADDVFELLNRGKQELVTAETKMVRQSSRSHSIFQLCIERRYDVAFKKRALADGIYFNPIEDSSDDLITLDEDMVVCGKMDICDLAGSERLGKTMVEGINRSEARYINSSLLELGNVIYALSEGRRRHIPFRNSTLTRLLQECLGSSCQTSFIVCVAPSSSEAYETRCSLNFGTRARTITNKERMCLNVEVDYKLLTKKLSKKIELLEIELCAARPIRDFIYSSLSNLNVVTTETQTDIQTFTGSENEPIASVNDIRYMISLCEMLEVLIENSENLCQYQNNYDVVTSSAVMTMFTMATNGVSFIQQNLTGDKNCEIFDFTAQCLIKMESVKKDMLTVEKNDKHDLFAESSYCLSETCNEIECLLSKVLSGYCSPEQLTLIQSDASTLYRTIMHVLETNGNQANSIINSIKTLLHLLQLLQISRILLDQSKSASKPREARALNKPCTWSSSVDENISSDFETISSTDDTYFSDFPMLTSNGCEQKNSDVEFIPTQKLKLERSNPPLKVKLNRSHSFKVKGEMKWHQVNMNISEIEFENHSANLDEKRYTKRKSRVHSFDYPMTKTKRFVHIDDGSSASLHTTSIEIENHQMKAELLNFEKRCEELTVKYKQCVCEKEKWNEKLMKLQQDKMNLMTQRDYMEQRLKSVITVDTEDSVEISKKNLVEQTIFNGEHTRFDGEHTRFNGTLEGENEEAISRLQKILKEKDEYIFLLESENQKLIHERDETKYENESQVKELSLTKDKLNKTEDKTKQQTEINFTFAEEVSNICSVLETMKQEPYKRTTATIEDIASLETELYFMIENFVRYESALNEINNKVNLIISAKHVETPEEVPINKLTKKTISPKVVTTRSPVYIAKRVNSMKKVTKKQIDAIKREFSEQSLSAVKEIKACRATRIKDLVYEKIKMNELISKLERDLITKDLNYKESKKQIELLVQELGKMDITLNRQNSMLRYSKQTSVIAPVVLKNKAAVSDVNNMLALQDQEENIISSMVPENVVLSPNDIDSLPPIGCIKQEMDNRKYTNLDIIVDQERKTQDLQLTNENYSLQRKIEYLEESNSALLEEIRTIKSTSQDRKMKIQELREKTNNLIHELEFFKRQATQMQARNDTTRIKLEKRITKLKDKILSLETYSRKLEEEINIFKKRNGNNKAYMNDSGLVQDESEYE